MPLGRHRRHACRGRRIDDSSGGRPARAAGRRHFWAPVMSRPNRTDHIRLTSHPGAGRQAALSHCLGRGDGTRARTHHRHGVAAGGPQRHRHARRLLRGLPGARRLLRRARSDSAGGPHQHAARRCHRPVPAVGRRQDHRLARSVGSHGRRSLRAGDRPGHRHPPQHRRDARAARPRRDAAGGGGGPARQRRRGGAAWRRPVRGQGRDRSRSGISRASPSASA